MKKANISVSVVLFAIAAYMIYEASGYFHVDPNDVGPQFFPIAIAILLIVLGIGLIVSSFIGTQNESSPQFFTTKQGKSYIVIAMMLVYVLLMPKLGFCVTSCLFLFALIRMFGYKKYLINAAVSISVTALIYLLFKLLLSVPLPSGWLI